MMKQSLSLAGMITLALLATPKAHAVTPLCQQVMGLPPVSSYVQSVIDRSEASITYAAGLSAGTGFANLPKSAQNMASFFLLLIDSQLALTEQARDLTQNTACLHADTLRIQCQIDKVRDEINAAFAENNPSRAIVLQDQIPFLRERMQYLLQGAADPSFSDPTWGLVSNIDPPGAAGWCCQANGETCAEATDCAGQRFHTLEGCVKASKCSAPVGQSPETSRLCPFTSDYGPAMRNGYGCDVSVMGPRATYASSIYERDVMEYLVNRINEVSTNLGATPSLPASHKMVNGCMRKYGYCSGDPYFACAEDADCTTNNAGGTCTFDLPTDAFWNPVRSPFSVIKDHLGVLSRFLSVREQQGISRRQSDELKTPAEFSQQQSSESMFRKGAGFIESFFRGTYRQDFGGWSRMQGREEVNPFTQTTDAQMTMAAALPFTGVGGELKKLVTEMDGVRGFLVKYAYFARRTCMNRPCSLKLEQILRVAYTDACFPYAEGAYKNEDASDPLWKKCVQDACIPLEGVELDGNKCVCYTLGKNPDLKYDPQEVDPTDSPDVCVPR
jgi:hypothetical protein